MEITPWTDNVRAEASEDRIIIALLPNAVGMQHAQLLNSQLSTHAHPIEPIIFGTELEEGANSIAHMTLLQFNCDRIPALIAHLNKVVERWRKSAGHARTRSDRRRLSDIVLHMNTVARYRQRGNMAWTRFMFWWADLVTAALNVPFMRLVNLVFFGAGDDLSPCKHFAMLKSFVPGDDLTDSETHMLDLVGYSHAGQWHITVGFENEEADPHRRINPLEEEVHFSHLALGRAGRNGTLVEIIKTWELN